MIARMNPRSLLQAAAVLAPLVIVQAARMTWGVGPSATSAAVEGPKTPDDSLPPQRPAPKLDDAERAAADWLASHRPGPSMASPMNHPAPRRADPSDPRPSPDAGPMLPPMRLTSVVVGADAAVATINGRQYTLGDQVADGWILTRIDAGNRSVTLTHIRGRVARLYIDNIGRGG